MKSKYILLFLSVLLCNYSQSQEFAPTTDTVSHEVYPEENILQNGIDFFGSEELLQMTLSFDIREFLRTKDRTKYQDAILTVNINTGDSITQHIKLKARGKMRCSYCSFPPLMLKFKDNVTEGERKQGRKTLKLVTHCYLSPKYENNVLKEYLAYRLFNLVTPYSFKTRLVRIHYVDIHKPYKTYTTYGILIENEDNLAERNNAVIIDNKYVTQNHMNSEDMTRVALFNYMIGNTDWSVPYQHNVKILKSLDVLSDKGIPVAYDFDYSGFVNTGYSAPREELPIKTVTERYYLGVCLGNEELNPVIDQFEGLKGRFLSTINEFEYISMGSKKQLVAYINSFYKVYKHQNTLLSDMNRTCKVY